MAVTKSQSPPVFLFGYDRSGTTLLSMMMGAHPDLAVPFSTTGLWYRYAARLHSYDGLASREALERLVDDLLGEERIRLWHVTIDREDVLRDLPTGSFAAVVDRFHALYAASEGKQRWASNDIATIEEMDEANRWFPEARFLHLVRDGRDVALSHRTYRYRMGDFLEVAADWRACLHTNMKMGAILGPTRYLVVRYEDLILDTEATLNRVCDFIGLPFRCEMLNYAGAVKEKVPERTKEDLWPALDKPPQRDKVDQWRREMKAYERIAFEDVAGPLLAELGYETLPAPMRSVRAEWLGLKTQLLRGGRWHRLKRRLGLERTRV